MTNKRRHGPNGYSTKYHHDEDVSKPFHGSTVRRSATSKPRNGVDPALRSTGSLLAAMHRRAMWSTTSKFRTISVWAKMPLKKATLCEHFRWPFGPPPHKQETRTWQSCRTRSRAANLSRRLHQHFRIGAHQSFTYVRGIRSRCPGSVASVIALSTGPSTHVTMDNPANGHTLR
jgi:hypothetical protein